MLLVQTVIDFGRLQIAAVTREVECMSSNYTNPNTNPKTTLALTLTDHHDAFESFCAPVFCDFVRNYSCTVDGAVVTSNLVAFRLMTCRHWYNDNWSTNILVYDNSSTGIWSTNISCAMTVLAQIETGVMNIILDS